MIIMRFQKMKTKAQLKTFRQLIKFLKKNYQVIFFFKKRKFSIKKKIEKKLNTR